MHPPATPAEGLDEIDSENDPVAPFHIRITQKPVVDAVIRLGMAAVRAHGISVQFHCGLGDANVDL